MLAYNASVLRVPFEMGRLLDAPQGDPYVESLILVVDEVGRARERARQEAESKMNAMRR